MGLSWSTFRRAYKYRGNPAARWLRRATLTVLGLVLLGPSPARATPAWLSPTTLLNRYTPATRVSLQTRPGM